MTKSKTEEVKINIEKLKADKNLSDANWELNKLQQNSLEIANEYNERNNNYLLQQNFSISRKLYVEAGISEATKRTEEATADLRELQYWTEIANTIIKLAQVVGNLTIGGKTGKMIREYTEKRMNETPPRNSTTVTQHYDPEMQLVS